MNKTTLAMVVALFANALFAGWEDWQYRLYHADFEEYAEQENLDSKKGAKGGMWSWWPVTSSAKAMQDSKRGGMYMDCSSDGDGVAFIPDDTGYRILKTVTTRVLLSAYGTPGGQPPDVPEGARAAFAIYSLDEVTAMFKGLETPDKNTRNWVTLYGPSQPIPSNDWYDVSMKFMEKEYATGKSVLVQYRLMNSKGEYEPLHTEDGKTWLFANGDPAREVASKIEYRGDGGIKNLNGGEPKRGLLIGLVPWREILVEENVYNNTSGDWAVLDSDSGVWTRPFIQGNAYAINVANGSDGYAFIPKNNQSDVLKVVEFSVRFSEPNDNDKVPDDVSALVRIVEEPLTDLTQVNPVCRFACLGGERDGYGNWHGRWYTNTQFVAELDADYTVEVSQDDEAGTVYYRIRRGYGGEGGAYKSLLDAPTASPVYSPFYAFFGGHGLVYEIKSTSKSGK